MECKGYIYMKILNYINEEVIPLFLGLVFMLLDISLLILPIMLLILGTQKTIKAKKNGSSIAKPIIITLALEVLNAGIFAGVVYLISVGGEKLSQDVFMCFVAILTVGSLQIATFGLPLFVFVFGLHKILVLKRKKTLRKSHILVWVMLVAVFITIALVILSQTGLFESLRDSAIDAGIITG